MTTDLVLFLVLAFGIAAVVGLLLTPVAIRLAGAVGAIDLPDSERRVHRRPIARLGGLAVGTTFVLVGVAVVAIGRDRFPFELPAVAVLPNQAVRVGDQQLAALFGGVILAMIFGFVDDRWQIRARYQFLGQLALAVVALLGGILFTQIANPFQVLGAAFGGANLEFLTAFQFELGTTTIQPVPAILTALWVVGMINCINWIDGLDGLSTGVSLIAAVTLGIISVISAPIEPMVALLCAVLAGSLAGFLPWNFHPARIFIGTAGVMAVGYALAVLSILGTAKVAVALLILGVPIIDTFWIIIRRVASGVSPFEPDRGHLHHRLLDLGLSHRGAVLLIYAICILLGLSGLVLASSGAIPLYAFLGVVIGGGLVLYLLTRRTREALDARSYPDEPERADAQAADDPGSTPTASGAASNGSASSAPTGTQGHRTRPVR